MSLIEVKNAIKTYSTGDSSFNALNDVSLSVEDGEFVAIMGTSGSGKSTFMNMLGCLDKPTSGSYLLDGIDVINLDSDKLAEIRNLKLGFVFQGFNLISRTSALENVELPMIYKGIDPVERIERAMHALKIVGLQGREEHLPNQLSGGQQQRVAIGRALITKPKLILADEPTGNLDSKNSQDVIDLLTQASRRFQQTILMITHNKNLTASVDQVFRVTDGVLTDLGGNTDEALS